MWYCVGGGAGGGGRVEARKFGMKLDKKIIAKYAPKLWTTETPEVSWNELKQKIDLFFQKLKGLFLIF